MGTVSIERRTSSSKVLWANIKALSQARHDRLNLIWFIFCLFEICILGSYWINFSFEKKMTDPPPPGDPRTDLHELPWPLFASLHVLIRIMLSLLFWDPQQHHWWWGQGMGPTVKPLMQNITWNIRSLVKPSVKKCDTEPMLNFWCWFLM